MKSDSQHNFSFVGLLIHSAPSPEIHEIMMIHSLQKSCFFKHFSFCTATPKIFTPPFAHALQSVDGADVAFFDTITEVNHWKAIAPANDLFLQPDYLKTLELAAPEGMQFAYLVFYKKGTPIGIAYCQILDFNATKSVPTAAESRFKKWLLPRLHFKFLICGNMLSTGEHAFHFCKNISTIEASLMLSESLDLLQQHLRQRNIRIRATILKDVFETSTSTRQLIDGQSFIPFRFQPSMILDLNKNWQSFEDYLTAMSSKYRVRVRRALKKASDLRWQEWEAVDIENNLKRVNALYQNVAHHADFNAVHLHENHFLTLKMQLPEQFRFFAVFEKENLIGFYTTLQNGEELEAHFLGYDANVNQHYQLYLTMLYRMVQQGIEAGMKRIVFARTAMEIKSSVGAMAHELFCYLKPNNVFWGYFFNHMVPFLEPKVTWIPRHPFQRHE